LTRCSVTLEKLSASEYSGLVRITVIVGGAPRVAQGMPFSAISGGGVTLCDVTHNGIGFFLRFICAVSEPDRPQYEATLSARATGRCSWLAWRPATGVARRASG